MTDFYLFLPGPFLVLLGLALTQVAFGRLRARHLSVWEKLGRPHVILNNPPSLTTRWMRYLLRRKHKSLNDPVLRWLGDMLIGINLLVVVWLFAMIWWMFRA